MNLHILCMLEDTFSLDVAHLSSLALMSVQSSHRYSCSLYIKFAILTLNTGTL